MKWFTFFCCMYSEVLFAMIDPSDVPGMDLYNHDTDSMSPSEDSSGHQPKKLASIDNSISFSEKEFGGWRYDVERYASTFNHKCESTEKKSKELVELDEYIKNFSEDFCGNGEDEYIGLLSKSNNLEEFGNACRQEMLGSYLKIFMNNSSYSEFLRKKESNYIYWLENLWKGKVTYQKLCFKKGIWSSLWSRLKKGYMEIEKRWLYEGSRLFDVCIDFADLRYLGQRLIACWDKEIEQQEEESEESSGVVEPETSKPEGSQKECDDDRQGANISSQEEEEEESLRKVEPETSEPEGSRKRGDDDQQGANINPQDTSKSSYKVWNVPPATPPNIDCWQFSSITSRYEDFKTAVINTIVSKNFYVVSSAAEFEQKHRFLTDLKRLWVATKASRPIFPISENKIQRFFRDKKESRNTTSYVSKNVDDFFGNFGSDLLEKLHEAFEGWGTTPELKIVLLYGKPGTGKTASFLQLFEEEKSENVAVIRANPRDSFVGSSMAPGILDLILSQKAYWRCINMSEELSAAPNSSIQQLISKLERKGSGVVVFNSSYFGVPIPLTNVVITCTSNCSTPADDVLFGQKPD